MGFYQPEGKIVPMQDLGIGPKNGLFPAKSEKIG